MSKRKIPMRKCVVTGEMKPKRDMVRVVKNKEDGLAIDPTGKMNGRGAYLSLLPEAGQQAKEEKSLDKPLGTKVPDEFYEELAAYIEKEHARKELL